MDNVNLGLSDEMQNHLSKYLTQITSDINHVLDTIERKDCCILNEFEHIHHTFHDLQKTAASYYLNSYLSSYTDRYQALSTAIQHFSERKHGALMVVERNDMLETFLHSGIPVGANLSYALLESIFYPGSPLHDGAVLIKGNTIISAGNVLPLSQQVAGDKKMGTRHRAALGLSEISDAVVLVVSEETGKASFALDGKMYAIHPGGMI
ncbi:MAG: sporulation-specific diadenylate cyclase CdaS [Bacillota bacterium]|uniref:Diadenylate cyclase n=1 Tax=Virgibacillus salarius TaxID=447199 RepID=A0A941IBC6_9BACI|nr:MULTISPECIES: sporulation-specific diadenylate cyclase CdaS [Bacillaceae]MBR7796291.1 sporulation-specific diadenylate cyclase CdaS [Virgibacillus salarius]MCC2248523.1 sporulation-specific diadenylate cyclase CdaS [Virgibacillus sp. AGTR]MDY7043042.1 sporulation-specific diadenylate cyclase CdaS [Virgibacillus sp. M23]QRZ16616.1 diadenylate cyclase [Virgibacillus sp. AGTR]WBX79876.1 sporulation-specific diadenylate cyclase CdaS [Virgibacillus salarius]